MAIVSITLPLNNGDAMPDPVTGTVALAFAVAPPVENTEADAPAAAPVATVVVTFVRTDANSPDVNVPAVVAGNAWAATSAGVANGTYTVVATGSFGAGDSPGSDARNSIHKP